MGAFGDGLKRERERRKITLEDIAGSTKIGIRFLRALEDEHFDQLPGGIFNRGFLRAYAKHVGLDEEQTIADYLEASGEGQPPVPDPLLDPAAQQPNQPQPTENNEFQVPWTALAVVLVVIALGFAIWGVVARGGKTPAQETTPSAAPESEPRQPQTVSSSVSSPSVNSAKPQEQAAPSQTPPRPATRARLSVLIKARDECWVSISADGKQSEVILESGEQQPVDAGSEIILKAGNVGVLDFWFNGKHLPSQGDVGQVKTLAFDANGIRPVPIKTDQQTQQP